jgi:hypothetical protein
MSFYWGIESIDVKRYLGIVIVVSWFVVVVVVCFLLEVELCLCVYLLLGFLKEDYFFVFSSSFSPCVRVFHLLFYVGLDLWKDIV